MEASCRSQVEQLIRQRLASDPRVRERLLSDPKGTLAEVLSTDIPENVEVIVHEATPTQIHLMVPATELSDAELKASYSDDWMDTFANNVVNNVTAATGPTPIFRLLIDEL
jgi:hypothetical protein